MLLVGGGTNVLDVTVVLALLAGKVLLLNTVLTVVVAGAILLDMAMLEEEYLVVMIAVLELSTKELWLAVEILGLAEGIAVEEVAGAVDETDVGGCTEPLIDIATLDPELIEMETLDELALLDDTPEL